MGLSLRKSLCICGTALMLFGCGKPNSSDSRNSSSFISTPESLYCGGSTSYPGGITITARAQFYARQVTSSGLQGPTAAQDIRYAEVVVLNTAGAQVQCGETDGSGNISLTLPKVPGTYTLQVNSRANNAYYKASVLNNPSANAYYFINTPFMLSGSESTRALYLPVAPYNGSLEGGAFNILDQIYIANEFLRNNSACPSQGNVCTQFTVAPKSTLYWTKGFSPASYFGSPNSAISFFSKVDDTAHSMLKGIYLLGGVQGNIDCADTDHFDNSVVLHEYGHFLENVYAKSESPGGSHNGNAVIDPRLSWSEGWANFVQGAIRSEARYRDTIGNSSCTSGSTYLGVNLDLQNMTAGQDYMNVGTTAGEGIFREVSVSRALYRTMASAYANVGFAYIWKIFSSSVSGFASGSVHFRNIGKFNELLASLIATHDSGKSTAFAQEVSSEYQLTNTSEYAQVVTNQPGAVCTRQIQGVSGSGAYSNQLKSNDFFALYYDGTFSTVTLKYSGSGTPSDLDLYVYREDYVYADNSTIVAKSDKYYPEISGTGQESVNLWGLPIGWYLINVKVDSDKLGSPATYYLETSAGVRLCP